MRRPRSSRALARASTSNAVSVPSLPRLRATFSVTLTPLVSVFAETDSRSGKALERRVLEHQPALGAVLEADGDDAVRLDAGDDAGPERLVADRVAGRERRELVARRRGERRRARRSRTTTPAAAARARRPRPAARRGIATGGSRRCARRASAASHAASSASPWRGSCRRSRAVAPPRASSPRASASAGRCPPRARARRRRGTRAPSRCAGSSASPGRRPRRP